VAAKQASSFRLVATLGIAGLLSGLVLVGVYITTKPRIERNQAEALERAIFKVLPGTVRTSPLVLNGDRLEAYEGRLSELADREAIHAGYAASGELVGYAIPGEGPGYMDTIGLIFGFDPEREVIVGMEVLESRETPGLGDKVIVDADFHRNFDALAVEPEIVPVKKGAKTGANEVDCITGATISSESVVAILDKSVKRWRPWLERVTPAEETASNAHVD
jgi:electron transport complex protein RnfG